MDDNLEAASINAEQIPVGSILPIKIPASEIGHQDDIEKLTPPFYIRWTSGPDYEEAYLCVEDGEPDMRDFAKVSFGMARLFKLGMETLVKFHISDPVRTILTDLKKGIDASQWHDVYSEQMKRILVAESMIDKIDIALEGPFVETKDPTDPEPSDLEYGDAVAFLEKNKDKDWSLDWLVANVIAQERSKHYKQKG